MNETTLWRIPKSATLAITMEQRLQRCHTPMTKFMLFNALTTNGKLSINGVAVILGSIQREDGSGSSFNLLVYQDGKPYKCYCRTTD